MMNDHLAPIDVQAWNTDANEHYTPFVPTMVDYVHHVDPDPGLWSPSQVEAFYAGGAIGYPKELPRGRGLFGLTPEGSAIALTMVTYLASLAVFGVWVYKLTGPGVMP